MIGNIVEFLYINNFAVTFVLFWVTVVMLTIAIYAESFVGLVETITKDSYKWYEFAGFLLAVVGASLLYLVLMVVFFAVVASSIPSLVVLLFVFCSLVFSSSISLRVKNGSSI